MQLKSAIRISVLRQTVENTMGTWCKQVTFWRNRHTLQNELAQLRDTFMCHIRCSFNINGRREVT